MRLPTCAAKLVSSITREAVVAEESSMMRGTAESPPPERSIARERPFETFAPPAGFKTLNQAMQLKIIFQREYKIEKKLLLIN